MLALLVISALLLTIEEVFGLAISSPVEAEAPGDTREGGGGGRSLRHPIIYRLCRGLSTKDETV